MDVSLQQLNIQIISVEKQKTNDCRNKKKHICIYIFRHILYLYLVTIKAQNKNSISVDVQIKTQINKLIFFTDESFRELTKIQIFCEDVNLSQMKNWNHQFQVLITLGLLVFFFFYSISVSVETSIWGKRDRIQF